MTIETDEQLIEGPAGVLELRVETPAASPAGFAVICHPHPLYGGALDNKVVWTLSRAALARGLAAVRFNFRGVGKSAGAYAEGDGETEDARAVLRWCESRWPALPYGLMGFSFGAAVALRLAAEVAARQLVTIAPPLQYFVGRPLPQPRCPWLVVHGDADEVIPWSTSAARLNEVQPAPEVHILSGAGHFFHGQLTELRALVEPRLRMGPV